MLGLVLAISLLSTFVFADNNPPQALSGASVINDNCSRCHNSRPVHEFSLVEWQVIMPHMRERAHLTAEEVDAVLDFIKTVSTPISPEISYVNLKSDVPKPSGEQLATKYSCLGCHRINGTGGILGPPLDNVIADKGMEYFIQKVKNPQFNNSASPMPKMPISENEIEAIATYLSNN